MVPPTDLSVEHQRAIIAALTGAHAAVQPFAEARYPSDTIRQSAYLAVVLEDVFVAVALGTQLGLSVERTLRNLAVVLAETEAANQAERVQ